MKFDPKRIAAELLSRKKAEESLYEFLRQAWPSIEGGKPFQGGWHLEAVAEHLEAVVRGEIPNLGVNIPPRTAKSTLVSVCFAPWVWMRAPETQWLYTSYSQALSMRDSLKCRRLIESPFYRARWGDRFALSSDQSTKLRFENDKTGYRIASSVDGTNTGEGGDFLICLPGDAILYTSDGPMEIGRIVGERIKTKVLCFDHETGMCDMQRIEAFECSPGRQMVEIELDDRTLTCTEDHPVFVEGRGYIRADEVKEGDVVTIM